MQTEYIKRYLKYGLIALIVIIIAIVSIQKCSHQVKESKVERVENKQVVENTHRVDSLETVVTTLQQQRAVKDAKDSIARIAANRLISYWKTKALKSREKVDTIIQSNPDLKEAFEDSDSLLAVTEARNQALEKEKLIQGLDLNKIIDLQDKQLGLNKQTISILTTQRDRFEKKADKRFIVGPGFGIDYRGKATVSVNVTYRLLRF